MNDHAPSFRRRSRPRPGASSLKGIIAGLERRARFIESDIQRAQRDPEMTEETLRAKRSDLLVIEGAIERCAEATLPDAPPFPPNTVTADEWRQASTWPAVRQMALLCATLEKLAERVPHDVIREAFRGAHYEVRSESRRRNDEGEPCAEGRMTSG